MSRLIYVERLTLLLLCVSLISCRTTRTTPHIQREYREARLNASVSRVLTITGEEIRFDKRGARHLTIEGKRQIEGLMSSGVYRAIPFDSIAEIETTEKTIDWVATGVLLLGAAAGAFLTVVALSLRRWQG